MIDQPYLGQGYGSANRVIRYSIPVSVDVIADSTDVGGGTGFTIRKTPDGMILRGFMISAAAPAGSSGGTKTVAISVGTVANANTTLSGTDVDVMVSSGSKTAAFLHGDAADDHVDAYFPVDNYGKYLSADTTYYLNYIGKASTATANPGTVTCLVTVYAFVDVLG